MIRRRGRNQPEGASTLELQAGPPSGSALRLGNGGHETESAIYRSDARPQRSLSASIANRITRKSLQHD